MEVDLHFVAFVDHKGFLIELDGRRNSPINHGKITVGLLEVRSLLPTKAECNRLTKVLIKMNQQDTVEVVKKIIEITKSIQFNLVTLSPTPKDE